MSTYDEKLVDLDVKNIDLNVEVDRSKTNSSKWNAIADEEVYPLWLADMDFKSPPAVLKRLRERIEEGVMGYDSLSDKYYEAVAHWLDKRHAYKVKNEDIICCPEATVGLSVSVQLLTEPGDEVLLNTPIYNGFFSCIRGCGRIPLECPLKNEEGKYSLDFEDMEKKVSEKTKAMIICNPRNPTGNVWSVEELEEICKFCKKHKLNIISDEVHYDLIFNEKVHTMTAKVAEKMGLEVYTIVSPAKTFNIPGSGAGSVIVKNRDMNEKFKRHMYNMKYPDPNAFAEPATIGAYMESEEWFDKVRDYIEENRKIFEEFFAEKLPMITVAKGDATYLMWIDCTKLGLSNEELEKLWVEKCKVLLGQGIEFGRGFEQFRRVNVACPRPRLMKILNRIEDVFKGEGYIK